MSRIDLLIWALAALVLAVVIAAVLTVSCSQPIESVYRHDAHWPFSTDTEITDR